MLEKARDTVKALWGWLEPEGRQKRLTVVFAGLGLIGASMAAVTVAAWTLLHKPEKPTTGTTINAPSSSGGINGPVASGAVTITNQSAGLDIAVIGAILVFAAFCILAVVVLARRGGAASARQTPVAAELGAQPPSVTIYNGPSPEQQAVERAAREATSAKLDRLLALAEAGGANQRAAAAGIPEAAVRAIVARLGGEDIDSGELIAWLDGWIVAAQRELAARPGQEDEALEAARNEAEHRFRAGDLDSASRAFMEEFAREEQREVVRQEERKRHRLRLLEEAVRFDELALNGEAAAIKLRLIAGIEGASGPDAVGRWLFNKASEFYERGDLKGESAALLVAIATYREALSDYTRDRLSLQWAGTQNNLGNALQTLGQRESGTQRLSEAVEAYRNALLEYTRDRVPLQWAMTQNNLGAAIKTLGQRESGTQRLSEAVEAYKSALLEFTRDRVPLDWAMTQNNLGAALQAVGQRESGTQRLSEAVEAYRNALLEFTHNRVPLDWAATQNNLGTALNILGQRESGTQRLSEAVEAYRNALLEYTRDRVPLQWAGTQNNLGNALQTLGQRESGTQSLSEAIEAYRNALLERTRDRAPLQWAMTQNNLGNTIRALAEKKSDPAPARQAIAALEAALAVFTEAKATYYIDLTTQNLTLARALLARLEAAP